MRRVENLGFISRLDTRKNDFSSKILDDYKRNTYRGGCKNRLVPYKSMVKKKIRIVRALIECASREQLIFTSGRSCCPEVIERACRESIKPIGNCSS